MSLERTEDSSGVDNGTVTPLFAQMETVLSTSFGSLDSVRELDRGIASGGWSLFGNVPDRPPQFDQVLCVRRKFPRL